MKKVFFLGTVLSLFVIFNQNVSAQSIVRTIVTDEGDMIVKRNSTNQNYLEFEVSKWNTIFPNYTVNYKFPITIFICINIASRKQDCNGGIGFRCGFCDNLSSSPNNNGIKANRSYNCSYVYDPTTTKVNLTINENIDWNWLSK